MQFGSIICRYADFPQKLECHLKKKLAELCLILQWLISTNLDVIRFYSSLEVTLHAEWFAVFRKISLKMLVLLQHLKKCKVNCTSSSVIWWWVKIPGFDTLKKLLCYWVWKWFSLNDLIHSGYIFYTLVAIGSTKIRQGMQSTERNKHVMQVFGVLKTHQVVFKSNLCTLTFTNFTTIHYLISKEV
jgi:hypothetical protein